MKPRMASRGAPDPAAEAGPEQGPPAGTSPPAAERGAAVVAALTAASRGMGLIRTVVATAVLGLTFLGNTYASTNSTSNLLFDLFAGGALSAVVVPCLSAALSGGDPSSAGEDADSTASALLNVALLCLTPVVLAGVLARGPVMDLLTASVHNPAVRHREQALGAFLLLAFLPQIWLYAIGAVTTGALHARHRFAGPALAPLVSSVVVTGSYLLYAAVERGHASQLGRISGPGKLLLGLGTTAGVLALTLAVLVPAARLGMRWRPTLRIPPEARRLTRRLLGSALAAVAMEQLLLGLVLVLGNGVDGGVVAYYLGFTLLELPWAILAVPIAVAAFPGLSGAAARADTGAFAERCAAATRNVVVLALGGSAAMLALAGPGTHLLLDLGIGGGARAAGLLAPAVAAFAPGLTGYGAYALLTRVAYAVGDGRSPTLGAAAGFGGAAALTAVAFLLFSGRVLIAGMAAAFSIGITAGAVLMAGRLARAAGRAAFAGTGATLARGLAAAVLAAGLGIGAAHLIGSGGTAHNAGSAAVVAAVAIAAYLGVLHGLGDRQLPRAVAAARGKLVPGAGQAP
ncbi:MAG TPA: lipid II flippase MurJ [Actinomycetota bacterium]|nr:lipid II flippase MurJ [Actinomycetota bacterium]